MAPRDKAKLCTCESFQSLTDPQKRDGYADEYVDEYVDELEARKEEKQKDR